MNTDSHGSDIGHCLGMTGFSYLNDIGLVLTLFQTYAPRLGLTRTAPQFVERTVVVYTVTIGACVLWQRLYAAVRARLLSGKSAP